jgi:AcrR family transcriptional regulator
MTRRAATTEDTRRRIVEAAVALHGTLGPAATTVMGVAEEAGVTRATVYRHFPDDAALFQACSAHWLSQQVPPDPAAWVARDDPLERMQAGLADLYRFFRAGDAMLRRIYGDMASLPEAHRRDLEQRHEMFTELLLDAFTTSGARRRRLRAVLGHAVDFWTWRSLCIDHGLADRDAIELLVVLAAAAAGLGAGVPER